MKIREICLGRLISHVLVVICVVLLMWYGMHTNPVGTIEVVTIFAKCVLVAFGIVLVCVLAGFVVKTVCTMGNHNR